VSIYIHSPKNQVRRIDAIWAAVSSDDTGEGVCAVTVGGLSLPLIAADQKRLTWITEQAELLAAVTGKQIKIIRLSERTEEKVFGGRNDG
jgi:hypothetical protein